MALPLKAHPIYYLRKTIIIIAVIGILLCWVGVGAHPFLLAGVFFLFLSVVFALTDLFCYAAKKIQHPDEDPKWPSRKWMVGDVILAIILQFLFWQTITALSYEYHYDRNLVGAYGALAYFLCSLLHAWCFWKQFMARTKQSWLSNLLKEPCARCGYSHIEPDTTRQPSESHTQLPTTSTYVGASADFRKTNAATPQSSENAMEEGLLSDPDFPTGYGSIDHHKTTIEQPDEVVVGKGKKKKTNNSACARLAEEQPESQEDR